MSYFSEHYSQFWYPLAEGDNPGFRLAQLGAIHAAAAHFVSRNDPAIFTMPTGSGKTAVLVAAAFVLRAKKVLVIAPSRLVREQIAEEIASLRTLREAGAIGAELANPTVFATNERVTDTAEWEAMRQFDVVVGTIQSISPEYSETPEPPADLFDVVMVDEAHHSPARTWRAVLDHFSGAKSLLFTATPFRQDEREIKGRFTFTYDLKEAYRDGIFGQIAYVPVAPEENENHDLAIAKAAQQQFDSDRTAGFRHKVMVRTDSRKRAAELATIYRDNTRLRLSVVTGENSLRYVKKIINSLRDNELDGIVCVNMLGEGFNFPSLKIAAIHSSVDYQSNVTSRCVNHRSKMMLEMILIVAVIHISAVSKAEEDACARVFSMEMDDCPRAYLPDHPAANSRCQKNAFLHMHNCMWNDNVPDTK